MRSIVRIEQPLYPEGRIRIMEEKRYGLVNEDLLTSLSREARINPRRRQNYNLHQPEDRVQRFLNAVEPASYVRPHRHLNPPKSETFIVLRGSFLILLFNDRGDVLESIKLDAEGVNRVIDVLPGTWHGLISLKPGSIYFEVKDGPYVPLTDKDFAPWAPPEGSGESDAYLQKLKGMAL